MMKPNFRLFFGAFPLGRATASLQFQSFFRSTSLPKKGFPLLSLSQMPVILTHEEEKIWLDPEQNPKDL
ncbi:MAG: hypothetical protein WD431_07780, partial [Cyclobacteriaceae bacterium]